LQISKWRQSPSNHIRAALWAFQDPEFHFIVGTIDIHLFDCIRKRHAIETQKIWGAGVYVGQMVYEYAFSYGSLGYGYSNQLLNPLSNVDEMVSLSAFPRIRPKKSEIKQDPHYIRIPSELKVFSPKSFIQEIDDEPKNLEPSNKNVKNFSSGDKKRTTTQTHHTEPKHITANQVEFSDGYAVHCKVHMNIWQKEFQADFNNSYGRFICVGRYTLTKNY